MGQYAKKVAICYCNNTKTIFKKNHVRVVTNDVELYLLEPMKQIKGYRPKPLFSRV